MDETTIRPSAALFEPLLGNEFDVHVETDQVSKARLVEVTPLPATAARDDVPLRKDPFSLIFKVTGDAQLEQRMYTVEHETSGALDMFLVPVGFGEYQVIYN